MAELIQIPAADGTADAYVARSAETPKGGVLFFMDAIGLRPRIAEMAEVIASWGYLVLAPHVFYRHGNAAELAPKVDLRDPETRAGYFQAAGLGAMIAELTPAVFGADADAYVAKLQELLAEAGAPDARIGTTGYCMGARLATLTAAQFPGLVVAAAGFHGGGLVTDAEDSPHRSVTAEVEYLYGHADNDHGMTPEHAARLAEALEAAGATYTAAIYPDGPHGFTMNDTASWHEPSYERHLVELKALLERTLG